MEFAEDFIKENNFTQEQIQALNGFIEPHIETLEDSWKKAANDNAEGIITGAAKSIEKLTGIQREQGQKVADYLSFASEKYFEGQKSTLEQKQSELESKLKNSKVDETLKAELDEVKTKLDKLKEKEAVFADYEENDYKGKFEQTSTELNSLRQSMAFNSIKPNFPETANPYEVSAKWNDFIKEVTEKNNIAVIDGKAYAIDKENEHKKVLLSNLVEKDKNISQLAEGRNLTGFNSNTPDKGKQLDGLPFEVTDTNTKQEIVGKIKEYLTKDLGLKVISREYSDKFAEFYNKITRKTAE